MGTGAKTGRHRSGQLRGGREPAVAPAKTGRTTAATMTERRFPPPWSVKYIGGSLVVKASNDPTWKSNWSSSRSLRCLIAFGKSAGRIWRGPRWAIQSTLKAVNELRTSADAHPLIMLSACVNLNGGCKIRAEYPPVSQPEGAQKGTSVVPHCNDYELQVVDSLRFVQAGTVWSIRAFGLANARSISFRGSSPKGEIRPDSLCCRSIARRNCNGSGGNSVATATTG
jgi:hypothetical protein